MVPKTCWYLHKAPTENLATHGTPWLHDTHVPLMFAGRKWIRPGRFDHHAAVVDIAPTLALILHTRPPVGSEGRVLSEILAR